MVPVPALANPNGMAPQGGGMPPVGQGIAHAGAAAQNAAPGIVPAPPARGAIGKLKSLFGIGRVRTDPVPGAGAGAAQAGGAAAPAMTAAEREARQKIIDKMAKDQKPHFGMSAVTPSTFTAAPKGAAKNYADKIDAAHPDVINDPISGLLQKDRTIKFLKSLREELRQVCLRASNDPTISGQLKSKLDKEFQALDMVLLDAEVRCRANTENGHKILRDCFDNVSRQCRKIADIIASGSSPLARSLGFGNQSNPLAKLSEYFKDVSQVATELKRRHHTYNAKFDIDTYARKVVDAKANYAPGMTKMRTGSENVSTKDVGIGFKLITLPGIASFGPTFSLRRQDKDRDFIDEDKETCTFKTAEVIERAGVGFKWGGLVNAVTGNRLGTASANLKLSRTKGSYYDHVDPLASTKAEVQRMSNKWRLLCPSANPDAFSNRMFEKAGKARNFVAQKIFGVIHVPVPGMPNVNQNKLNKGAWNGAKLMEVTSRFSDNLPLQYRGPASSSIASLVRSAYADVHAIEPDVSFSPNGAVAPKICNPLQEISPLPSPFNRPTGESGKAVTRWAGGAEVLGSISSLIPHQSQMRASATASAGFDYSMNCIDLRRVKAPHEHLDPAYNKDIAVTHRVLRKLEETYRGEPKLHTYNAISSALESNVAQWKHDSQVQAGVKLDNADKALKHIKNSYLRFIELASMMNALQDKSYRNSIPDRGAKANAEFDALVSELFGITKFSSPKQRKFAEAMRNDPRLFMREGYDALSITLGKIGAHMFDAKKQISKQCDPGHHGAEALFSGAQQTDLHYASVTRLMNGLFLPISEEDLFRGASVTADASSENTICSGAAELSGGFWTSPLQYLKGNQTDPTSVLSPPKPDAPPSNDPTSAQSPPKPDAPTSNKIRGVQLANGVGIGGWFNYLVRKSDKHPNPVRTGEYGVDRWGAKGSGLAALFFAGGIQQAFINKRTKTGAIQRPDNADARENQFVKETGVIAQRMMLSDYSAELSIERSRRTPKPVGNKKYEKSTQYFRVVAKGTVAYNATLGVALHAFGCPGTISGSAGGSQSVSNVVYETMGPCPSYQLLQFVELKNLINCCQTEEAKKKDTDAGRSGIDFKRMENERLDAQVNFTKLRNMLAPESTNDYEGHTSVDAPYLLHKYFGTSETILGFMEKFMRYDETRREIGGPPIDFDGPRTEFHRFDDDDSYFEIIQSLRESEKFAPGALLNSKSDKAPTLAEFRTPATDDPRPKFDRTELLAAMGRVKAISKDMTSEERARCFLGGDPNSDGRKVFEAYIRVLSAYTDINNGIKPTRTYEMVVVKNGSTLMT